jgi:hypothetical protein
VATDRRLDRCAVLCRHPGAVLAQDRQARRCRITLQWPGRRIVFLHLPRLDGFKAGALNAPGASTSDAARWIGVVEAIRN